MKQSILIFILLIPLVSAIYGGESKIIHHFDKCSSLEVIVTGTLEIDKDEYSLLNCSETINNEWECNCYDNFDLIIETKLNTLNNYTINMIYSYGETTTSSIASYNPGGGSKWICSSWSGCKDGNNTLFCYKQYNRGINYTRTKPCDIEIIEKEPEENKTIIIEPLSFNNTTQAGQYNISKLSGSGTSGTEPKPYKLLIIVLSIISFIIITFVIIKVIINRRKQNE